MKIKEKRPNERRRNSEDEEERRRKKKEGEAPNKVENISFF